MVSSCSDDDTGGGALSYGKVTGVVTDDLSSPLEGVTVLVDGSGITATPDGPQATTNSQGVYTLENISIGTHIINPLAELSQCILDSSNGSIINVI